MEGPPGDVGVVRTPRWQWGLWGSQRGRTGHFFLKASFSSRLHVFAENMEGHVL